MDQDPSFFGTADDLRTAVELLTGPFGPLPDLPTSLPETGMGDSETIAALAPLIIGRARDLKAPTAFAHMDPPTPWVAWATWLWNAALNQNLLHPDVAPAAIEIETRVIDWIAPAFGMDGGHMTAGSTLANLTALWAAREVAGVKRVIASSAAHLSAGKAAHILGLGFETIEVDTQGRLNPSALPADLSDCALVLTAGATSTGAIDDLGLAGATAWTHVDAAWAGPLVFSDRYRWRLSGLDQADSISVSAHKWLFQPKESGLILFREAATAHQAVSFDGAYLAQPNVGVLGSRAAVAAPLLATLLAWGRTGLADRIETTMAMADDLHQQLSAHRDVEVFGDNVSGVILWRDRRLDDQKQLIARLPDGLASHTVVNGISWVRQVAANPNADVEAIWTHIAAAL